MKDQPKDEQQGDARRDARRKGLAYQGSVEASLAVVIAGLIGLWADSHFGTSPRYLLLGVAIGFGAFVLRLVRLGRQLQANDESDPDD